VLNVLQLRASTAATVQPEAGPALPPASPETIDFWVMSVATALLVQGLPMGMLKTNLWREAILSTCGRRCRGLCIRHAVSNILVARVAASIDEQVTTRLAATGTSIVSIDRLTELNSQSTYTSRF